MAEAEKGPALSRKRRRPRPKPVERPAGPPPQAAGPEPARRAKAGPATLAAGSVLVAAAVFLILSKPSSFAALTTSSLSADNLLSGVAADGPVLRSVAAAHFKAFAVENLLPVFVLLLPGLLLVAGGLAGMGGGDETVFARLAKPRNRRVLLAVLFGLTVVLCLAGHFYVVGHYPAVGDEFCYVFGADHLAAGKLTLASPPLGDSFRAWSVVNDGRWYSKVTVGWPLLLAAGRAVRLEALLNPLLAALSVVLLFLIGEALFGLEAGCLAALWGLVTPFFVLLAGTLFPHTAAAFLSLLFIFLLLKAFEAERLPFAVLAGVTLAYLLLVRPADGGALLLGSLPLIGHRIVRAENKRAAASKAVVVVALALAGIGLLMAVNLAQNGHPLIFGYQRYHPEDAWGFGANGHTLLRGLWHTAYSLMRTGAWGVPFVGLLALASLLAKSKRTAWLLLVPAAGSLALYAGYFTLAGFEYGPRYYLSMYLIALVPAAAGALVVRDALVRRRFTGARAFVSALALSTLVFTAAGAWPRLATAVRAQTPTLKKVSRLLADPPVESPSVIFLRDHLYLKNTYLTRNLPDYRTSRHIYVLYLTPEENEKVMALFPTRNFYSTVLDPAGDRLEFVPGVDNSRSAPSYFAAGLNAMEFDPRLAVAAFRRALELAPDEPAIMMNLARAHDLEGDKGSAVAMYARVLQAGAAAFRDQALFYLATALRELGESGEALKVYAELAGSGSDPSYRDRAAAWVDKLAPR